jgi:Mg-chelatase subunit ChlD
LLLHFEGKVVSDIDKEKVRGRIKMRIKTVVGLIIVLVYVTTILGIYPTNFGNDITTVKAKILEEPIESQDIVIEISKNSSAVGPNSVVEFSVELINNLSESLYDLSVNISRKTADLLISPGSDPLFTASSLDPESSTSFDFVLQHTGDNISTSVDLAILLDASGSMQEEIDSVIAELNNLTTTLSAEIPELRIGVIVFGSSIYSEYPMSNPNNYIQFTDNIASIENFINSWYAGGGIEPWGDALYLANSWNWRDSARKLIILIGDEDCDPGMVIGNADINTDPNGSYNGSDLLNIVTELKNKDVVISTVICEGSSGMTENQFQWIAEYTDGTSVFLPELENEGISLPIFIQEWTLEFAREYYREIDITCTWQDGSGGNYTNTKTSSFWIDFSPPSAIISKTITPTGTNQFSVDFLIDVDDISPIEYVNLYHNAYGSWRVDFLSPVVNTTFYRLELQNVSKGTNLSYLVECSDILRNVGSTEVSWVIVEPKFDVVGEEVAIFAEADDKVFSNLKVNQNERYYFILSGPVDIDLINMSLENSETNVTINSSHSYFNNVSSLYWRKIIIFDLNPGDHAVELRFPTDSNNYTLSYSWVTIFETSSGYFSGSMTDTIRVYGVKWMAENGTYFGFNNEVNSPLVLRAEVYNSSWGFLDSFTVVSSLTVTKTDHYFILVWATLRTGDFTIVNTVDEPDTTTTDPYYANTTTNTTRMSATFFPNFLLILIFMIPLTIYHKKRKRQN